MRSVKKETRNIETSDCSKLPSPANTSHIVIIHCHVSRILEKLADEKAVEEQNAIDQKGNHIHVETSDCSKLSSHAK